MSTWDHIILEAEPVEEFFEDLEDLDDSELFAVLESSITEALTHAEPGEADYTAGLGAATLVAIWNGAPYTAAEVADRFHFLRAHIGHSIESLTDAALNLLDKEMERLGEEAPEGIETFVEALS